MSYVLDEVYRADRADYGSHAGGRDDSPNGSSSQIARYHSGDQSTC